MPKKNQMDDQDALRSFYERRHPAYKDLVEHWQFLEETYNGGRKWFEKHIHKYLKEGDKEFADRKNRAYRFNHTREVVQLVQKYLSKADVHRSEDKASDAVKRFWDNATLNGLDIDQLMSTVNVSNSIGGRAAIVVDNNYPVPENNRKLSKAELRALGGRVYAYLVPTKDVLDYAFDEDGDGGLLWIKLREISRDDTDPIYDAGDVVERVRLWTRTDSLLFEEKEATAGANSKKTIEIVEHHIHDLGEVPVVLADHTTAEDAYRVPSLIDDVAYLDRSVANYLSNLDAIIQDQTFSQLVIPAASLMHGTEGEKQLTELGTKRLFTYDAGQGSSAKPEFISPDPKQAGVIMDAINKIISEIYHTVGLAGERTKQDNSVGIDNSSGVAKAYDFERVNSLLLSKAINSQIVENKIVRLVRLWEGEDVSNDEKLVSYPETFDVVRLVDDLVTAEALSKVEAPREIRRRQMRVVAEKLFPQVSDEERAKIEKDIENWLEEGYSPDQISKTLTGDKPVASPNKQGSVTSETPVEDKPKQDTASG